MQWCCSCDCLYYCLAHASELEMHQVKVRSTCPTVRTRIGTTHQCCMYTRIDASGIDASQTVGHQLVRSTVVRCDVISTSAVQHIFKRQHRTSHSAEEAKLLLRGLAPKYHVETPRMPCRASTRWLLWHPACGCSSTLQRITQRQKLYRQASH